MKPTLHKGTLTTWKDNRGFGFIKPDGGGTDVFLHISALTRAGRRPKVGDTIVYQRVVESGGKIRATRASIQGVVSRPFSTQRKPKRPKKPNLLEIAVRVVVLIVIFLVIRQFRPSRFPSPISTITQPNCVIKGNISHTSSNKLYHLPGMEDYEGTVISPSRGERWFCSEEEAIANGWRKAPQ